MTNGLWIQVCWVAKGCICRMMLLLLLVIIGLLIVIAIRIVLSINR